jgi:hypothetical protein
MGLTCGRALILDSAPILAWRRTDPNAAFGYAPAHHLRPLLRGCRLHILLCVGLASPSSSTCLPPTSTTRPSPVRRWSSPSGS